MDFLQVKSPFLGVMCNPTVAIATNKNTDSHPVPKNEQ